MQGNATEHQLYDDEGALPKLNLQPEPIFTFYLPRYSSNKIIIPIIITHGCFWYDLINLLNNVNYFECMTIASLQAQSVI